jgi:peroxiredoxin
MELSAGADAPDFTLRDQFGQDVTLSSFVGKKSVLLMFYPWAFSNVCTGEMQGIRSRLDEFLTFDTEVLGISIDHVYTLRTFSDEAGINFPLLADFWPHGAVAEAYGVFDEKIGVARRSSYVIDKQGKIAWSIHNPLGDSRDLDEQLKQLRAAAQSSVG